MKSPQRSPHRKIRKILVANRGEIAVRVMRACHELDIRSVAVYSEADRGALHVQKADEAYLIGPPQAQKSYLDIERILDAVKRSGADAVHPGYGFLSERAEFVEACDRSGVTFIGPSAEAMRTMGEKPRARAAMAGAGVPVVPGDNGAEGGFPSGEEALVAARRVGFPVMLKAAGGGGGRGMRLVDGEERFVAAFDSARREAKAAFGNDAVYVEKAIVRPRHVEIQVFGDHHGNYLYFFERDCSVQRRNQKVIEEAPSPFISGDADLRARMGEVAVRGAAAVGYVGAGTFEFLVAPDRSFYFLEMNTRLQVEHPVTEAVTGVDLVHLQIRVAEGQPLPMAQRDLRLQGAAIECRVYAEDPVRFLPSPGRITLLRAPQGPHVRDDSGVFEGAEISTFYDPLISKLSVWGPTREEALRVMARALHEYRIVGIRTNLPFHRRVMTEPDFLSGQYDTGYIEAHKEVLLQPYVPGDESVRAALQAAAIHAATEEEARRAQASPATVEPSAWRSGRAGWRT